MVSKMRIRCPIDRMTGRWLKIWSGKHHLFDLGIGLEFYEFESVRTHNNYITNTHFDLFTASLICTD